MNRGAFPLVTCLLFLFSCTGGQTLSGETGIVGSGESPSSSSSISDSVSVTDVVGGEGTVYLCSLPSEIEVYGLTFLEGKGTLSLAEVGEIIGYLVLEEPDENVDEDLFYVVTSFETRHSETELPVYSVLGTPPTEKIAVLSDGFLFPYIEESIAYVD